MLLILSDCSLVPHRLIVISASCCCTFGPFVSSSCREATSSLSNSSSPATFVLSGAVAGTGGSASSCAKSSSAACTLMESSSLLDLHLGSFCSSEDSSEEGETEGRLRRSWPAPGGLRLEELASIFPVGRRAHTSVRSCVIVPMFVLSCLRVYSVLGSRPGGSVFWPGGPAEEGTTSMILDQFVSQVFC